MADKNYVNLELDFLEKRLEGLRKYLDKNPADKVQDRKDFKVIKGEDVEYVVQTKEAILKCIRDSMKDYASLLDQINKLREAEEKKLQSKGDKNIPLLFEE